MKSKSELEALDTSSLYLSADLFLVLDNRQMEMMSQLYEIGQGERIFPAKLDADLIPKLQALLDHLLAVDRFYAPIGGLVGYHQTILDLLKKPKIENLQNLTIHPPPLIDVSTQDSPGVHSAVVSGIEHLHLMGEIYPVGGAADRLDLKDEESGQPLPAAMLQFCGKTLLEHLIADVQAKEYLYFQLTGEQIVIPIAMMTSSEKENHSHVEKICEEKRWFGRMRESFKLFVQPLVPALNKEGEWGVKAPMQLLLKPGGHGVIWRLAEEEGIFDWFAQKGKTAALVRQINNVIAGVDQGLLALAGIGFQKKAAIGFASCPRLPHTTEGMDVLLERKVGEESYYCLTNIEYCDLDRYGIEDEAISVYNPFSKYPANTNVLYIDLEKIRKASQQLPFPGILVNAKKMKCPGSDGRLIETEMLRLESTMQNIADAFQEKGVPILSFATYNQRSKTISPIKRSFASSGSLMETPEGCLYDLLKNATELLVQFCKSSLPPLPDGEECVAKGWPFYFRYHPALGPLYSIIGQKLQGLEIKEGSEVCLDLPDLQANNLKIEGAFHLSSSAALGYHDSHGILHYHKGSARCRLKNVRIQNKGWGGEKLPTEIWKCPDQRIEVCRIYLEDGASLLAEDVTINGDFTLTVPAQKTVRLVQKGDQVGVEEVDASDCSTMQYTLERENIRVKFIQ